MYVRTYAHASMNACLHVYVIVRSHHAHFYVLILEIFFNGIIKKIIVVTFRSLWY